MNLDDIYEMMKEQRQHLYEEGKEIVKFTVAEFFELYQLVCYMQQIKHIVDGV